MKKFLILAFITGFLINSSRSQCPPSAFAYQSLYPQCPSGCGVLLLNWPAGVLVNIYGGSPLSIISSVAVTGTLGSGQLGDAFTCVPCGVPLVFASQIIGATSGCVITVLGTVPVKINTFSVNTVAGNVTTAKWMTSNELVSDRYVVQRSQDGTNYTDLTTLSAHGRSITNTYSYTDATATAGTNFYRLKIVEITGNTIYSETAVVKSENKFGFSVYPNPVVANFKVSIAAQFLPALIEVFNAQGVQVVTNKTVQQTTNISNYLPKGFYMMKVTGNNDIPITKKIVVN